MTYSISARFVSNYSCHCRSIKEHFQAPVLREIPFKYATMLKVSNSSDYTSHFTGTTENCERKSCRKLAGIWRLIFSAVPLPGVCIWREEQMYPYRFVSTELCPLYWLCIDCTNTENMIWITFSNHTTPHIPLTDSGRQTNSTGSHVWLFHLSFCDTNLSNATQFTELLTYIHTDGSPLIRNVKTFLFWL